MKMAWFLSYDIIKIKNNDDLGGENNMFDNNEHSSKRKYGWVDQWAKMTGERAKIDAKVNNTYIVYATKDGLVKEFPNGEVKPYIEEGQEKSNEL